MRQLITVLILCCTLPLKAQLQDGSIAPDFNFYDINGQQHHLYSYLSQGKTVILNFSEAWCQVCWSYHLTGAMRDFYTLYGPGGTDEAMVLFIEKDSIMGIEDIRGATTATAGDWTNMTPYPILDTSAANEPFMAIERPTIYGIYPDKTTFNLGRLDTDELYAFVQGYTGEVLRGDTLINPVFENVSQVRCAGFADGSIDLSVTGPGTSYTYSWNRGDTTQDISRLDVGTYRCTITDNLNNRHITDPITITEPDSLAISFAKTTPTSETAFNGSVAVNVTGGTLPYDYLWNTGGNDFIIENLGEGNYSVQVFDANGCQTRDSTTLEIPDCSLVISINVEPTSCDDNPDGEINIIVAGATAPVEYAWSNGETTRDLRNLASGAYELTVSDAMGCSATVGGIIEIDDREPPRPRVREPFTLYLNEAGVVELSAAEVDSGSFDNCGILDMQIEQSVFNCSNLGRNFLEFTVIDQNLNIATRDFEVIIKDTLEPYFECPNDTTVIACGGVVNYTPPRIIDNCPQGALLTRSALGPGAVFPLGTTTEIYNYVTNGGNTRLTCSLDITVEALIDAEVMVQDVTCPGATDGVATVDITAGNREFNFEWSNGQTTQTAINMAPGSYTVTVSDGVDCDFIRDVFVGEPVNLGVRLDSIKAPDDLGDVYITPLGGTPPYRYSWSNTNGVVSNVQDPQNLPFDTYELRLEDANDCLFDYTLKVDLTTPVVDLNHRTELVIQPNPNQGSFLLRAREGQLPQGNLEIINLTGQLVYNRVIPAQLSEYRVEANNLAAGAYIVKLSNERETGITRIMIR